MEFTVDSSVMVQIEDFLGIIDLDHVDKTGNSESFQRKYLALSPGSGPKPRKADSAKGREIAMGLVDQLGCFLSHLSIALRSSAVIVGTAFFNIAMNQSISSGADG